ncbi:sigma-70 family RNA polymerase sigma factor [Pseudothauera nasutitermitis]|uniref:Sigma-70 family RNA polymerase sigma factor n=1 Tax=Pseudothauera nasutitermitis TaxID=2565930 RepID=A0A4S4AZH6_9RHOO|nr:sigma-70 family RNA polymerase sigma factor [Pseudothauera nasutitermitis]THF65588.1 sigma-70 family RNA polymerase sigma factor [Pseudothauera nasutitermitis]
MSTAAPPDGFSALYRDHHRWLHGWLRRRLNCTEQAADLAQDTFLRLHIARQQRQDALSLREPRAYLTAIAKNLLASHWRRQEIERAYLAALAARPEPTAASEEARLEILQVLERIDAMLDRLKPQVREAFLLAHLEGMTCQQVAVRMGLSRATIERHIATALRHCYIQTMQG